MDFEKNDGKKFDKGISLLAWAYNEEELIGDFLARAVRLMDETAEDWEIVLVDDGSTDRTNAIAREFAARDERIRLLNNDCNLNVGFSSKRAIQKAGKEFLFWQTVDWGYDISDLRSFLKMLKNYDVVHGVRARPVEARLGMLKPFMAVLRLFGMKHLTRRSDNPKKAVVSVVNYMLIRLLFGLPLSDYQNITFYRTDWIQSLKIEGSSSFVCPELLLKSHWAGKSIREVPINFLPRKGGKAKGTNWRSIKNSMTDIFTFWFLWVVLGRREKAQKGSVTRVTSLYKEK